MVATLRRWLRRMRRRCVADEVLAMDEPNVMPIDTDEDQETTLAEHRRDDEAKTRVDTRITQIRQTVDDVRRERVRETLERARRLRTHGDDDPS